jgi:hypothetical protein
MTRGHGLDRKGGGQIDPSYPQHRWSAGPDRRGPIDDGRAQRPRAGEARGTLGSGDGSETQATSFVDLDGARS